MNAVAITEKRHRLQPLIGHSGTPDRWRRTAAHTVVLVKKSAGCK